MSDDGAPTDLEPDEDPFELLRSADSDDRAFGALLLGSADYSQEAHDALFEALNDADSNVVGYAAQSLAMQGEVAALDRLIDLRNEQSGQEVTPVAWAVSVLGNGAEITKWTRAYDALIELRRRGSPEVVKQVDLLLGRRGWSNLKLDVLSDRAKQVVLFGWVAGAIALGAFGPETISKLAIVASTPILGFLIWAMDSRGRAAILWTVPLAIWNAFAVYATESVVLYVAMMAISFAVTAFLIFNSGLTLRRTPTVPSNSA